MSAFEKFKKNRKKNVTPEVSSTYSQNLFLHIITFLFL